MAPRTTTAIILSLLFASTAIGQACQGAATQFEPTIAAKGFHAYVIAKGLSSPRGLIFDKEDNLLVVEKGKGITALTLATEGNCVKVASKTSVVSDRNANHAITLSPDGSQLFASSISNAYSWPYNAKEKKVSGQPFNWVTGMSHFGHSTRTLLMSKKAPGILLVSRGSGPNIDRLARNITNGVSQIRSFNVAGQPKSYKYTDGKVIAWGLRNSVGLGENPADGGIWSNENSSDNMFRQGKDIHETSPAEEINYHGTLTGNSEQTGKNFGYPECATAWDLATIPNSSKLKVGDQFTYTDTASGITDETCAKNYVPPRITLPPHWAPIDIEFNSKGTVAFMTAHGSWNKKAADGYRLFAITFKDGQPTHPRTSKTAHIPILTVRNLRSCFSCFRPTGIAMDSKGRLFMASDATGEIYAISRTDGRPVDAVRPEELEALERFDPGQTGKGT